MKKTGKILTIVWSILGILIIFLSAGILIKQKVQSSRASKEEKEIVVEIVEDENNEENNVAERAIYIQNEADMQLLQQYQAYNSDVIGYMRIEGTVLDHPLVQTVSDEEYYLYKDLDKNYNSHGVPFLSAASLMEGQGRNCIIYGHNISKHTKDVFADLVGYRKLEFYKEHPIIRTISKSGTRNWLVIAYFITDNADKDVFRYSDETDFLSKRSFEEYFAEVGKRNWLDVPVKLSYGDTFLTLSSCSLELAGSGTNRMVVIAKQLYADEEYEDIVEKTVMAENPLLPERLR